MRLDQSHFGESAVSRRLGVLEWFQPGEYARVERVREQLLNIGVRRLRIGVSWADWHARGGREWYAWLLPRLAADFEVLPCLHDTPPSLGLVPTIQSPPRRPRDFADFVDVFLDSYGALVDWVELWNEPNNLNDWDWTIDPGWERFCELVTDAGNWLRERGKRPVLGGMCPVDPNWLSLLGERGVLDFVDAVGIHGFPGGWTTIWHGWDADVARVQEVLDRYGCTAEVWITEAGFSTWRHDELAQLRALVDVLSSSAARVYWYAAEDLAPDRVACDGDHVDDRHYHFGLADHEGRPKLAGRVLAEGGLAAAEELAELVRPQNGRPKRGKVTLVTGGAGFVGTNLVDTLVRRGERVRILDNLSRRGVDQNLRWLQERHADRIEFAPVDVRDRHGLRDAVANVGSVFHLAAQVAVTTSAVDPIADFEINLGGTVALLDELRRLPDPPPIVFTSTNKVYGTLGDVELERDDLRWIPVDRKLRTHGVDESRPIAFCTPYGCSKGGADQYVLDWAKTYGIAATVLRMSCIYGPHQHGTEDQGWVAHFLLRARDDRPITIYGDGAQMRDVLFVDDLVRAFVLVRGVAGEVFNIGGGPANALSLLELIDVIEALEGRRPRVFTAEQRLGDQRWYVSDYSKLERTTGWRPEISPAEGVEALHRWLAAAGTRLEPVLA